MRRIKELETGVNLTYVIDSGRKIINFSFQMEPDWNTVQVKVERIKKGLLNATAWKTTNSSVKDGFDHAGNIHSIKL